MKPNNPFVLVGYRGREYFCDREQETQKLLSWISNDSNVTLMAPRRYGKTGLIHNVFAQLPEEYKGLYLDIYSTHSLAELVKLLADTVVGSIDSPMEKTLSVVGRFFRSCRPTVTAQADGSPKFSFDVVPAEAEATLRDVFDYLKSHERKIVIAFDEFQQILEYPEKGTEALLRSLVQDVPWVRFIFAGSRHHLMSEIFATAKHPFYNSTDMMVLNVINPLKYAQFARSFFAADGKAFDDSAFLYLYNRFDGVTWYVQRILNWVWNTGRGLAGPEIIDEAISEQIEDRSLVFRDLIDSQPEVARRLLPVIAAQKVVKQPTAAEFLEKARLSASSVRSALADLVARDIVYHSPDGYRVYERFFAEWLRVKR
ncbi:MAG: ATP-binding protein [Kiritimatiellia bacterium]